MRRTVHPGARRRPTRLAAAALALVVGAATAGACSSDDGASPGSPETSVTTSSTPESTTTTLDPLAGPVLDACGNDVSALTSTVWAFDPATGAARWSTPVPLAASYLLHDESGAPRIPLVLRDVEVVLDTATGEIVATPTAGAHEVLIDPSSTSGTGGLLVDGKAQPATIEVGGLRITTAAGETGQTSLGLTATDASSSAPAWRAELGAADAIASVSPPVAYGDVVVVVTSPPQPTCP